MIEWKCIVCFPLLLTLLFVWSSHCFFEFRPINSSPQKSFFIFFFLLFFFIPNNLILPFFSQNFTWFSIMGTKYNKLKIRWKGNKKKNLNKKLVVLMKLKCKHSEEAACYEKETISIYRRKQSRGSMNEMGKRRDEEEKNG